jgi:predicted RecA/RadA family phage recombinase
VLLEDMGNNPGMGASDVPEGGDVIELGDSVVMGSVVAPVAEGVFGMPHTCDSVVLILVSVGSHIGFAPGVNEFGDSAAAVAEGVFGMPHTCDSLVLTCLSVRSHVGFASGVVTSDPVDGERWRT